MSWHRAGRGVAGRSGMAGPKVYGERRLRNRQSYRPDVGEEWEPPKWGKTWQGALDYVASINSGSGLCGYKDWRLPNINELESLINAGEANPSTWLNSQGFSNVQSVSYWSSTTYAFNTAYAWIVNMWVATCTPTVSPTPSTCGQYVPDS